MSKRKNNGLTRQGVRDLGHSRPKPKPEEELVADDCEHVFTITLGSGEQYCTLCEEMVLTHTHA